MSPKDLFLACLESDHEQREALLSGVSAEVSTEVRRLLAAHEGSEGLFEPVEQRALGERGGELRRKLGPFLVGDVIGAGGMGIVYRAQQEFPRRDVALKILPAEQLDEDRRRRFEGEADALARLEHPYVTRIYEAGVLDTEDGDLPYIAMELIEGQQLHEWARATNPPRELRLRLIEQLAEGTHYAHERGVVHRDLKPSNVLVSANGTPKIIDFGVARVTDRERHLTRVGELVGTLAYMSPEQTVGEGERVDARSDQYALGAIAYELLTGRMPIDVEGQSLSDAARLVREQSPAPLRERITGVSNDLGLVIARALAKDPGERYATTADFGADVARARRGEPVSVSAHGPLRAAQVAVRRHRVASALLMVLVVSIGIASVWLAKQNRDLRSAEERALVSLGAEQRANRQKDEALREREQALLDTQRARERAEEAERELALSLEQARAESERADEARALAENALVQARIQRDHALGIESIYESWLLGSSLSSDRISMQTSLGELLADLEARAPSLSGTPQARSAAHLVLGRLLLRSGNAEAGEGHVRTAIQLARQSQDSTPDRLALVRGLEALAWIRLDLGDQLDALQTLTELERLAQTLPAEIGLYWRVRAHSVRAHTHQDRNETEAAIAQALAALELLNQLEQLGEEGGAEPIMPTLEDPGSYGLPPLEARTACFLDIGICLANGGASEQAREVLERVLHSLPQNTDTSHARSMAFAAIARSLLAENQVAEAETAARQAIREADAFDRPGLLRSFVPETTLALALLRRGRLVEAEQLTDRAVAHYRASGERALLCQQLSNRSFLRENLGRQEDARADAEESLEVALAMRGTGTARALDVALHRHLGCALRDDDLEAVRSSATMLCDVRRELYGEASFEYVEAGLYRGHALRRLGETELAREVLENTRAVADSIDDHEGVAMLESELGQL